MLTTGGDCSGCTSNYEEPAARAAVAWLNDYENGLAGHPITLDVCIDSNDPGKGADCANQMLRDDVVAVVLGSSGISATEWKILHDGGVPVVNHSTTSPDLIQDAKSTFILYDPAAQTVTLPIAVAKDVGAKKVSLIVIDVPDRDRHLQARLDEEGVQGRRSRFQRHPGAARCSPTSRRRPSRSSPTTPTASCAIIGHDAFCIPALNALNSLGYHGTITTISYCITDAMRKACPGERREGSALRRRGSLR